MEEKPSSFFAMVERCEAAITRIRAAVQRGDDNSDAVIDDWEMIKRSVAPLFGRFAETIARYHPDAADEVLDEMFEQLRRNIWGRSYTTLETQFGAHINTLPLGILRAARRKYRTDAASLRVESLDETDEMGRTLHDRIVDPHAQAPFERIVEHEALAAAIEQLPIEERTVIALYMDDWSNNNIAAHLGVAASTASRIRQQAIENLRRYLEQSKE